MFGGSSEKYTECLYIQWISLVSVSCMNAIEFLWWGITYSKGVNIMFLLMFRIRRYNALFVYFSFQPFFVNVRKISNQAVTYSWFHYHYSLILLGVMVVNIIKFVCRGKQWVKHIHKVKESKTNQKFSTAWKNYIRMFLSHTMQLDSHSWTSNVG